MKDEVRIYLDPHSLLVIGPKGISRRYTPFAVVFRRDFGSFKKLQETFVQKILPGDLNKLIFEVEGKPLPHSLFLIP